MNKKLYNTLITNISTSIKLTLNEGAWGYKPLNSDSALDLRDDINDKILKLVYSELLKKYNKDGDSSYNIIGIILYILKNLDSEYCTDEIENFLILYHKCLINCENDKSWQKSWSKPNIIKYELENAKDEIITIIKEHSIDLKFPDEYLKYLK